MECPKCYGDMETVLENETIVDRCNNCRGLYFDQLTQALLPGLATDAERIDVVVDDVDGSYDDMVYVECPKCDKIMDQRLVEEPNRIRFEFCPTCNATFLDSGELREYLSPDFIEDFRSLLPER